MKGWYVIVNHGDSVVNKTYVSFKLRAVSMSRDQLKVVPEDGAKG